VLRVEPEIKAAYVASGAVKLAFHPMLDHGDASLRAHRAAECAGALSAPAFWAMHDLLFARQGDIWSSSDQTMTDWAGELGLDTAAFAACMAGPEITEKVTRLDQARREAGIRQRPSFAVNTRLYAGALPFAGFQQALTEAGAP
jgi:protein-disulfide isomerase